MTNQHSLKYRPVLTAEQILQILHLAKNDKPLSSNSLSLIASLAPFAAKIENAGIQAAYTSAPRTSSTSLEALGFPFKFPSLEYKSIPLVLEAQDELELPSPEYPQVAPTKEERWAKSYAKYKLAPDTCSLSQLLEAREHMYLNDLLTSEELAEFEANSYTPAMLAALNKKESI